MASELKAPKGNQAMEESESPMVIDPRRYAKHRWKFLLFGAVSGLLMGVYSSSPTAPGNWLGDLVGGILLWYVFWWLWAWSRKRRDRADA